MDKETFRRLLQKQVDGQTSPEEEVALERAFDQFLREEMETAAKESITEPGERGEVIRQKIYRRINKCAKSPFNYISFLKVAAAVIVVGFSLIGYSYRFDILDVIAPMEEYSMTTGSDAVKTAVLEDGSIIWLNKNSSISYPKRFRGNRRTVRLRGTAYFQVAHNKEKPFTVKSATLDVKVLGTSFVVSDAATSTEKAVTVLTGKVNVAAHHRQVGLLLPNQQIRYNSESKTSKQHKVNAMDAIAFTKEDLDFRDVPLSQILQVLHTRFGIQAKYNVLEIQDLHFSGLISKDDSLGDVLDILSVTLNFQYKIIHDNTVIITQ